MSRANTERNRLLVDQRARGWTIERLARRHKISRTRVRQVLAAMGGDPRAGEVAALEAASVEELQRERARLEERIRADRRRLRFVLEELTSRSVDRIVGLDD